MANPEDTLTAEDHRIITASVAALQVGRELKEWWQKTDASGAYEGRYEESTVPYRPMDTSFGFSGEVNFSTGKRPVIGNVQEMFYDRPKAPKSQKREAIEWTRVQLREFVLKYFMRVASYQLPQAVPEPRPALPAFLKWLDASPDGASQTMGFGYKQRYFKRPSEEHPGQFSDRDALAITDLRELSKNYEWVVIENPIYDFGVDAKPFGLKGPQLHLPIPGKNYLVVSPEFVVDEENPAPGVVARYGLGYAFVKYPEQSFFGYGPGQLQPGIQLLIWELRDSGEIFARLTFASYKPERIVNLPLNPMIWMNGLADRILPTRAMNAMGPVRDLTDRFNPTFDPVIPSLELANWLTLGRAKDVGISREDLEKSLLLIHFTQHYNAVLGSLATWRQVEDWLGERALPSWAREGRAS